jgi:hypothetical protein
LVTPAQLEAAGASPGVAREWQSALTPGQIARHDHDVAALRVEAAGPLGTAETAELVDLAMTLHTRGGVFSAAWTCSVAHGRVVSLAETIG